jgi:predicted ATP-dependent endonuclease of OLD family
MKICKIYLRDFEQFQNVDLDFTHPETGEPLDKICFIGGNGTGKSKLLRLVNWFFLKALPNLLSHEKGTASLIEGAKVIFKILHEDNYYLIFHFNRYTFLLRVNNIDLAEEIEINKNLFSLKNPSDFNTNDLFRKYTKSTLDKEFLDKFLFNDNSNDLLIYSPSEIDQSYIMGKDGVPETDVNEAMSLIDNFSFYHDVSPKTLRNFWTILIYYLRKRQEEQDKYENLQENLTKTKSTLIGEFNVFNPRVLENLAKIWNKVLNKAGLEFDYDGANNPFQLKDNLIAYTRLINSKKIIHYNNLSLGIKNFIFRLGHIYSLYFNRDIHRSIMLIDEPENGLFPDFLFDLMDTYKNVIVDKRGQNNTQVFFATHNPIVAAQFQPYERVILEWKEDGSVAAKKGFSPIGDDPNDILSNDFELKDLMGPDGMQKWEEYISLKKKLAKSTEDSAKSQLIHEIEKIGSLYNFN